MVPKKFNFDNLQAPIEVSEDYDINQDSFENHQFEICNFKTNERNMLELETQSLDKDTFQEFKRNVIEVLRKKRRKNIGKKVNIQQFKFIIQEDAEYMQILYIMDHELHFEVFNNPLINILPKIKERDMHKFTKLAFKMKQGVQLNQKYENAILYKSSNKEKKNPYTIHKKQKQGTKDQKTVFSYVKYLNP